MRIAFKGVLRLVKSFALLIWDTRKNKLYGDQDNETSVCSCSDWRSYNCVCGLVLNGIRATTATRV